VGDEPPQKWEFLEETALGDISGVYLRLLNLRAIGLGFGDVERGNAREQPRFAGKS
jgi:hypothetical protein